MDKSEIEFICRRHLETPGLWIADYIYTQTELIEEINRLKEIDCIGNLIGLIAKAETEIVGFIWAKKIIDLPNSLYIMSLWTAPVYRKQGIATLLKQELENIAKIKGYTKLILMFMLQTLQY